LLLFTLLASRLNCGESHRRTFFLIISKANVAERTYQKPAVALFLPITYAAAAVVVVWVRFAHPPTPKRANNLFLERTKAIAFGRPTF
jgi:hypothetical protein